MTAESLEQMQRANKNKWSRIEDLCSNEHQDPSCGSEIALHRYYQADEILEQMRSNKADGWYDDVDKELCEEYQQLLEVNTVLDDALRRRKEELESIKTTVAELEHVQAMFQEETEKRKTKVNVGHQTSQDDSESPEEENKRLRATLKRISDRLTPQPGQNCAKSYEALILEMLATKEDYIAVKDIDPAHVELLQAKFLLKTYENDSNLVRLLELTS